MDGSGSGQPHPCAARRVAPARVCRSKPHDRELIEYWRRDGRQWPLFFAQIEAVETVIFLREARSDLLQGIDVPREDGGEFLRYACKMATGSGKTMVMGMLSCMEHPQQGRQSRQRRRFSDVVLVICPNVTIRNRLRELDPNEGDAFDLPYARIWCRLI